MAKYNNLRSERVMDALAEYIDKTGLQPGDTVPSERMLSEMWQVSRGTVREALGRMCREGILIPMQGKGTYVAPEKEHIEMKTMISFSEAFSGKGKLASRVLSQRLEEADEYLAEILRMTPGEKVHVLSRVREIDGKKLLLEISHIPAEKCPGLEKFSFENASTWITRTYLCSCRRQVRQRRGIWISGPATRYLWKRELRMTETDRQQNIRRRSWTPVREIIRSA